MPTSGTPQMGMLSTLLGWHLADPSSGFGRRRNDFVADLEGNGNPFVDHLDWAEGIVIVPGPTTLWLVMLVVGCLR